MSKSITLTALTAAVFAAVAECQHGIKNKHDVLYTGILAKLANVTLSYQKKHIMWRFNNNGECEDGVPMPTAFSVNGTKLSDETEVATVQEYAAFTSTFTYAFILLAIRMWWCNGEGWRL
ncbi:hypothetical protein GPALN_006629 [Globodera pallida]|nr:hypothetical protein GPALN_006629 [Globodera pallida]